MWHVVAPTYWFQELDLPTKYDQIFHTLDWTHIWICKGCIHSIYCIYISEEKDRFIYAFVFLDILFVYLKKLFYI